VDRVHRCNGRQTYGAEKILETYYATHVALGLTLTVNYQHANKPAYNRDRGPVSIFDVRAHAEF
jgi:high affinity Mn2+ porin